MLIPHLREHCLHLQLPRVGPRDFVNRETAVRSQEAQSTPRRDLLSQSGFVESNHLLSDLLDRLETAVSVARNLDTDHEDERPPSPSIYESDIGKTETFFRDSSSPSSNRDCRAPPCDVKLPGRSLSQSYRQVVDDFPVDD